MKRCVMNPQIPAQQTLSACRHEMLAVLTSNCDQLELSTYESEATAVARKYHDPFVPRRPVLCVYPLGHTQDTERAGPLLP